MLFLVRHGQTAANAERPAPRPGRPVALAARTRARPPRSPLTFPRTRAIVTSPLARTRETAAALGRPYEIDDRWIELDYGELDGVPLRDVSPAVWAQWRADPTFIPAGGESLAALGVRVREACRELLDEIRDHDVVGGHARVADQGRDLVGAR